MLVFLIICFVGFVVLLTAFVFGEIAEHGGELIHDVSAGDSVLDHGGGVDHAEGGPSILSTRIIASFITGFGGGGAISAHLGASYLVSSLLGVGVGFVMAGIVYLIVSFLYKQQASSGIEVAEFVGVSGSVTIDIPKDGAGQITMIVKGATITQLARSEDGAPIAAGQIVTVKKVVGDFVIVNQGDKK